ncbi:MAG: S9 family peptidase [Planctomycetota bacterium]
MRDLLRFVPRTSSSLAVVLAFVPALVGVAAAQDPGSGQKPRRGLELRNCVPPSWVSFGVRTQAPEWAANGKHLKMGRRWVDPRTGEEVEAEVSKGRPKVRVTSRNNDLLFKRGKEQRRLTKDGNAKELVHLSPTEGNVAFVQANNLFVVDTNSARLWQVTQDGGDEFRNGKLDWVYQEELYGRGKYRAHWWSPNGRFVAYLRLDERKVKTFTVIDHVPASLDKDKTVKQMVERYPKAGDPNPTVKLLVAEVATRKVVPVKLEGYDPDILVVRVHWTPDNRVIFQVQNRIQTWLDLVVADPKTGKTRRLFREESESWVNILEQPRFLGDGGFLWLSERTGYKHVYRYSGDGKLRGAVTTGEWAVREILKVDEKSGRLWFTATKDGAVNENAYRVGLDGKGLARLTKGDGWHEVSLNGDGSMFTDIWSTAARPPVVRLCDGDGRVLREIGKVPVRALRVFEFQPKEIVQIKARDGYLLDASVIVPKDGAASGKHAVWVDQYSGPDYPRVKNQWGYMPYLDATFHQFLCQHGVIVVDVNVRSASGRGQKDSQTCYKNFGEVELRDIEDTVAWVCANKNGDPARVGITGWSYGGFMAAYALTHSAKFKLGIAGAGVYDWRLYDTIYTERYMDTPAANPKGYRRSSCVVAARRLKGHLCIQHGTMDDNVHLQNAMQLVHALQSAGKSFDLMVYPKMKHGPRTIAQFKHKLELNWRLIRKHLLDGD